MIKLINTICIFLVSIISIAQNTNQIQKDAHLRGKISIKGNQVDGITVINLTSKTKTLSSNGGYFIIKAKAKDTIQFNALHIESKNYILKDVDFNSNLLLIQLNIHAELLKEVIVTNDVITAESLGIIPKGQKKYTPAERHLYTAKSGIVDPLINWMSGRITKLKDELTLEQKVHMQNKIITVYGKEYLINVLHIPEIYTNGFLFFISDDKYLAEAVKLKNKGKVEFRLLELAADYLKIVPVEIDK